MASRAWAVKQGIELALSYDPLEEDFLDGVALVEEEIPELVHQTNWSRQQAKIKSKYGLN